MENYVFGKTYAALKVDDRVTPELDSCLYCVVYDTDKCVNLPYKMPLDCCNGASIKQCPACRRVYVLKEAL